MHKKTIENETREKIPDYIRNIISGGYNKAFFKASLVDFNCDNTIRIISDVDGYEPLCNKSKLELAEMLDILVLVMENVERAKDVYLFPEDYMINENTVYVNQNNSKVLFLFHPEIPEINEVKSGIFYYLERYFTSISDDLSKPYIRKAVRILENKKFGNNNAILEVNGLKNKAIRWRVGEDPVKRFMEEDS